MSESHDDVESEIAGLAAEVAELLRFEHDAGAIGVIEVAASTPVQTPVETPVRPRPSVARTAATPSVGDTPPSVTPVREMPRRAQPAPQPRQVEVSMSDVDALLAQAKRARTAPAPQPPAEAPPPSAPPLVPTRLLDDAGRLAILGQLAKDAAGCTACRLHETRTKSVFSRGNPATEIVFVGEGPGFNEDKQGEPFVGAAGQLLDKMVAAMGFARDAVYICNVVKCRPPENRTPLPDEAAACGHFLDGQLDAVKPRVIVALGRCAAERLGCADAGRSWRGSWGEYRGVPVMPTYHPAYLLRNAEMKRPVWEDLQKVSARLGTLRGGGA